MVRYGRVWLMVCIVPFSSEPIMHTLEPCSMEKVASLIREVLTAWKAKAVVLLLLLLLLRARKCGSGVITWERLLMHTLTRIAFRGVRVKENIM